MVLFSSLLGIQEANLTYEIFTFWHITSFFCLKPDIMLNSSLLN